MLKKRITAYYHGMSHLKIIFKSWHNHNVSFIIDGFEELN